MAQTLYPRTRTRQVPSIADVTNYRKRRTIVAMSEGETWRDRLLQATKMARRSQRSVSLGAGFGAGYVNSLLQEGKEPSVDNAIDLCRELGISLTWLIYGIEMDPETEEILALLQEQREARAGILQVLRASRRPEPASEPPRARSMG